MKVLCNLGKAKAHQRLNLYYNNFVRYSIHTDPSWVMKQPNSRYLSFGKQTFLELLCFDPSMGSPPRISCDMLKSSLNVKDRVWWYLISNHENWIKLKQSWPLPEHHFSSGSMDRPHQKLQYNLKYFVDFIIQNLWQLTNILCIKQNLPMWNRAYRNPCSISWTPRILLRIVPHTYRIHPLMICRCPEIGLPLNHHHPCSKDLSNEPSRNQGLPPPWL